MKTFNTERLILRPWTADDLDDAYRTLVVEQDDDPLSVEAVINELQFDASMAQQQLGERFGRFAMTLKDDGKVIGTVVLMPVFCKREDLALIYPDTKHSTVEVEVGFALSKFNRGQGYATEAAQALIEYGFHELNLLRILAFTTRDNLTSQRVLLRLGMRLAHHPDGKGVIATLENSV